MELYLRQKVLSTAQENPIWDEQGAVPYSLQGRLFSVGSKIHLLKSGGEELFFVEEKFLSLLATFTLYKGEEVRARVCQKLAFLRPKLGVESEDGLSIAGNIWGMEVSFCKAGTPFARLAREWKEEALYHLTVPEEEAPLALALTVAYDRFVHGGGG